MSSRLAEALSLKHPPLALYFSPEDRPGARSFKKDKSDHGGWGCAMFLLGPALNGQTVSFSLETCHCPGAAAGLGLCAESYERFPGGLQGFAHFLSHGNRNWGPGREAAEKLKEGGAPKDMVEMFLEGEAFKKTPELVLDFVEHIPDLESRQAYVILEPLDKVPEGLTPAVVLMLANALQLSGLVYMANYARPGLDNVRIPFASGCQSLGALPLAEAAGACPRAVVGLTDPSARLFLRKTLGHDYLSFAMPWSLYQEMESNVADSFFSRPTWQQLHQG